MLTYRRKLTALQAWTIDSHDFRVLVETLPADAQAACDHARIAASCNDFATAIDALNLAVESCPTNAVLVALRAANQNDAGNYEDAVRDAHRAMELDGQLGYAHYVRAYAYAWRRPFSPVNGFGPSPSLKPQLEQAEADCTTAIALDHNLAAAYRTRADARILLGKFDEAIDDCTKGLALDPTFLDFIERGLMHGWGKGTSRRD